MLDAAFRPTRVLIVDDDLTVLEVVARYLSREGYLVRTESDGVAGLRVALADLPDLIVLDLMLPGLNGFEVCRQLHAVAPVPVIMLTALGDRRDRICGLELGADDYMVKPFSPRELTARVKAVLRRTAGAMGAPSGPETLRGGDLEVDLASRQVSRDGVGIVLTALEYDLLTYLMGNPSRVYRREELLAAVWGFSSGDPGTVTVHVRRLRSKVEADPSQPCHVRTVWGIGYRFDP